MIPWRFQFSGIRDYSPTLIDLSGANDHIMITGPNGAGKSTITFCMGAVLYSAKVDVEGLKSRNLPIDQTWKARISFLFKNDGLMKIDAPEYIEFTLKIVQDPGQPVKKEYSISTGDRIDEWEEVIRYTSGDRVFNFSAYKRDLQYKYKVDPDLFYLIWYQQEVNQFAVMHPEERFRIFSEMHGIDRVQRDWEESMEKVKDTEETVRIAETNVKLLKQELSMKKSALDRFLDNQKRLHEGGRLYIESLLLLEAHYKQEISRLEELIDQFDDDISESKDDLIVKKSLKEKDEQQLEAYKTEQEQLDLKIKMEQQKVKDTGVGLKQIQARIDALNVELEEITVRKKQIMRTEEEVKAALAAVSAELEQISQSLEQNKSALQMKNTFWKKKVELTTRLKQEIESDERLKVIHLERLQQYGSSYKVQEKIDRLDKRVEGNKDHKYSLLRKRDELQEEYNLLVDERNLSSRQQESIRYFRKRQIKAYPLRELIELDKAAQVKDEHLFEAIKYTIFFDGKECTPPNDLYHVPLMTVRPERVITNLPALHLKVKETLLEQDLPQAMKALWWVEQFFKDGLFAIKNGVLIDPMGIRGSQEKNQYILSVKALKHRKQEVEKLLIDLNSKLEVIETEIAVDTKSIQELNSVIHQVKESEAFMVAEHERVFRNQKYEDEIAAQKTIEEEITKLKEAESELLKMQARQSFFKGVLDDEMAVYIELGKMKEKYEERNSLQKKADEEKEFLKKQKDIIESLEDDFDELDRKMTKLERDIRNWHDHLEDAKQKISSLEKQQKNYSDDQEAAQLELVKTIKELEDLKYLVPDIYTTTAAKTSIEQLPSVAKIKQNRENGKIEFQNARTESGIDPAAEENYQTVKLEYERLDNEYKRTKILLEQDIERMENLKEQLETTINMRVLELQKRFKYYMSQFQFEGEISWESIEDRRSRTHFYLYIKARKEGHRGALEDVSVKARGGKVGKGVSGGEESLSSLLFALALLQNLQTTPDFIVMDEFDSALDEIRKVKVFDLYVQELKRKLVILTPKSHEPQYLDKFAKAFVVQHDPTIPRSKVIGLVKSVGIN
ncbi:chromosome segregation protein SMC [Neobacillus sp. YIM B02564]|uniref:Nuclease SbcCD subunit C n=1 Tax=Neobacillus paridis TaxID=2803862 RepID=A0ABS1TQA5_9BACI|nr:chromosome segregation protein SMC [Neobacillus paridis]MBL4952768.1 chromosome segregation protein SMC [Neobacillus paridis]